ncbi:hypothetical protein AGLY_014399, partial [Aphis glycines]
KRSFIVFQSYFHITSDLVKFNFDKNTIYKMTCLPRKTKIMIIYLLVGFLFQMDTIHTTPVPQSASGTVLNTSDQANSMIEKEEIKGVENVGDVFKTLVKNTGSTVMNLTSETEKSLKDLAKVGGRVTLGLGYVCSQLFNFLSATVATSGSYLASGVRNIDDVVGDWPVVGLVTNTLDTVSTQVANTFTEMSANGRKSRQKMIDTLRERLDGGSNLGAGTVSADSNSAAVDTTA